MFVTCDCGLTDLVEFVHVCVCGYYLRVATLWVVASKYKGTALFHHPALIPGHGDFVVQQCVGLAMAIHVHVQCHVSYLLNLSPS